MNIKQVEYICNLLNQTFEIPVFLLDKNKEIIYHKSPNFTINPLYRDKLLFSHYNTDKNVQDLPVIRTTELGENFIYLSFKSRELINGTIVVGPSLLGLFSDEHIIGLINDNDPFANRDQVFEYYNMLPILKNIKLLTVCKLLYFMMYQKDLDTTHIVEASNNFDSQVIEKDDSDLFLVKKRQEYEFHHDIVAEIMLFQSIKEGRVDKLTEYLSITNKGKLGTLSKKSYLRSSRNLAISGITLASKAAIDGGLYSEIALSLADHYIQKIEELTSVIEIRKLIINAFSDFANRVKKNKNENYSTTISMCQSFILDNIYEPIDLAEVSQVVGLHPNYLSSLFKKEIGISFSEYLQAAKVEEAKQLLKLTDQPISEISTMLNYIDQSYFTKVFKKHTGKTPYQYRKKK